MQGLTESQYSNLLDDLRTGFTSIENVLAVGCIVCVKEGDALYRRIYCGTERTAKAIVEALQERMA